MATPTNLYQYYKSIGQPMPSITDRRQLYQQSGLSGNYTGTASQNTALLKALLNPAPASTVSSDASLTASNNSFIPTANAQTPPAAVSPTPNTSGYQGSIVDLLNGAGLPSDFASRTAIARGLGIPNYAGTADQNNQLVNTLTQYISQGNAGISKIKGFLAGGTPGGGTPSVTPTATGDPTTTTPNPTQNTAISNLLNTVNTLIQGMNQAGYVLNPNKNITQQDAADFLAHLKDNANVFLPEAEKEILPYYQTQLNQALDTFKSQINLIPGQYQRNIESLGRQYGDIGMAQSGRRILDEALTTQQYQTAGNQAARQFAGQFGTAQLPASPILNTPTPQGQRALPLYQLNPDTYSGLKGTEEFQKEADVQQRSRQLEAEYRQYNAPMTRQLPGF